MSKPARLGRQVNLELRIGGVLGVYELQAEWQGTIASDTGMSVSLPLVDQALTQATAELKKINFTEISHALDFAAKSMQANTATWHR